jgi:hypothetical protein
MSSDFVMIAFVPPLSVLPRVLHPETDVRRG